jgi:hypothetical protein
MPPILDHPAPADLQPVGISARTSVRVRQRNTAPAGAAPRERSFPVRCRASTQAYLLIADWLNNDVYQPSSWSRANVEKAAMTRP